MSEWQPIDTVPKDGRKVILFDKSDGLMIIAWCSGDYWVFDPENYCSYIGDFFTHWMPLPEPPK